MDFFGSRSRKASEDFENPELEVQTIPEIESVAVQEHEINVENVVVTAVREVGLTHVPEVEREEVTPAFVQDNERSRNSQSSFGEESSSTANKYRH